MREHAGEEKPVWKAYRAPGLPVAGLQPQFRTNRQVRLQSAGHPLPQTRASANVECGLPDSRRPETLHLLKRSRYPRLDRDEAICFFDYKLFPVPIRIQLVAAGSQAPQNNPSCGEAFATRTVRNSIGIRDLEPPFLQIIAIVE